MPYGEEIVGLGGRSSTDKYVADDVRQGFTSYINDDETGLDYAQARMYAKSLGRFTGVDSGVFTPADPQNFNRYIYVQNNPMKFIDPTGNDIELTGDKAQEFLNYLEKNSGLKFKTKVNNGVITITGASKNKDFKGEVNKEFAKAVSSTANGSGVAKFNVSENQTIKGSNGQEYDVFVDDNGNAFQEQTTDKSGNTVIRTSNVNIADINSIAGVDATFAQALVGHFLVEGLAMRQRNANYDLGSESGEGAHHTGLNVERNILGQKDKRYSPDNPTLDQKTQNLTYQFVYTTVQYDVTFKSSGRSLEVKRISPPSVQRPKK